MKHLFPALGCFAAIALAGIILVLTHASAFPVLSPSGTVGIAERDLMFRTVLMMLIVVVPVLILAAFVAWHYREGNTRAAYAPKWEHSKMEELIWWSIPLEIVLVLSAFTWTSSHELDPSKALIHPVPALTVQVVALPWKWLFIYPEQGIASVNELAIPTDRPVLFQITADAPMNSFWIPALGGQMYAMTGMITSLYLIAPHAGDFPGRSANYSGAGFAQMTFTAHAMNDADFAAWVARAKQAPDTLSPENYAALRKPSDTGPVHYYQNVTETFADIVHLYMPAMTNMPVATSSMDMAPTP